MGKFAGKPYDPELRRSEHGSRLYGVWRKLRRHPYCEEWNDFPAFYAWAIHNGYSLRSTLKRLDKNKPYGPDNCVWNTKNPVDPEWADVWNATVNRIRKHYGMPPLEGTEYD